MAAQQIVHIVGCNAVHRRSVERILTAAGVAFVVYESIAAAFAAATRLDRGCILVDIGMPAGNAIDLQYLSALGVWLPVIAAAQRGNVAVAVEAMKAGAIDFIEKPFDAPRLLAAVDAAFARSEVVSSTREAAEATQRLAVLTPRERQVLKGIVAGQPNKVIAYELTISLRTVEVHRARMLERLGIRSVAEVIRLAALADLNADAPAEPGAVRFRRD